MELPKIFKRNEPKHWTEQKWAQERRLVIRGDVPGKNYDPEATVILDTDERRQAVADAIRIVIAETLSPEGPMWTRGLTEEELNQPLDLNNLLAEFEAERGTDQIA
jgi:hypothetical protein